MPDEIDALHATSGTQALADDGLADECLFGQRPVGLQDEFDGLAEIGACFVERLALSVGARSARNTAVSSSDMPPP